MIIPAKNDRAVVADHLNADLTALYEYGQPWNTIFAPSSLSISLKSGISEHPPLFLNNTQIPEVTSIKVFVYLAEAYRQCFETWKTTSGSVVPLRLFFQCQDISLFYKSWTPPMLEYGSILCSGAALFHVNRLDSF